MATLTMLCCWLMRWLANKGKKKCSRLRFAFLDGNRKLNLEEMRPTEHDSIERSPLSREKAYTLKVGRQQYLSTRIQFSFVDCDKTPGCSCRRRIMMVFDLEVSGVRIWIVTQDPAFRICNEQAYHARWRYRTRGTIPLIEIPNFTIWDLVRTIMNRGRSQTSRTRNKFAINAISKCQLTRSTLKILHPYVQPFWKSRKERKRERSINNKCHLLNSNCVIQ